MYQIIRMANVVKDKGVMIYELLDGGLGVEKSTTASKSKVAEELFWQVFEKNNPFCFSKVSDTPQEIKSLMAVESAAIEMSEFESPFEVFSIEVINSLVTVADIANNEPSVNVACYLVSSETMNTLSKNLSNPIDMDVAAAFILYEYDGAPYVFLEFMYDQKDFVASGNALILKFKGFDGRDVQFYASNAHSVIIKEFTDRLNSNKVVGYEKINERVKIKKNGVNEILKIKRIVHISPSKQQKSYSSENKIEVNWSHRFWRRGHWAHFWKDKSKGIIDYDRLGKNRDGVYCVRGKTWKTEAIVGEDHLPLVSKARIV